MMMQLVVAFNLGWGIKKRQIFSCRNLWNGIVFAWNNDWFEFTLHVLRILVMNMINMAANVAESGTGD